MAKITGVEISAPSFFGEMIGQMPHRPQQRRVQGVFHRVIAVLPMVLEEPGETDLFGQLKQHQLQQKDGGHLRQRPRPPTGRCRHRSPAVDAKSNRRRPDRNSEQRHQVPTHRDAPAHTAPGKINNAVAASERSGNQELR
jgi:hypothetical protein